MSDDPLAALARRYYAAFQEVDRETMEALLAPHFTFTSPFDDRIDREHYFTRCWPSAGSFDFRDDMEIFAKGDERVVLYSTDGKTGGTFRNAELFHFESGQIVSIEVFFGFIPKAILKDPPAGS
jgi:ketosteroid isomerase-like protein